METRALDLDDLAALIDLRTRAFGPRPGNAWRTRALSAAVSEGRVLGVYDGSRLAASGMYHLFEQWWHGRAVPMGGVGAVAVAPEDRGRGVGRLLTTALLDAMDGLPLSTLYPATAPVYRSAGYEHAGGRHLLTLRSEALRTLAAEPVKVRRAGPGDAAEVTSLLRRLHAEARHDGPIDRGEYFYQGRLEDENVYSYLADDGFLEYAWGDGNRRFEVYRCVAGSAATARALWAIVGTGSSIAETVIACVAPDDPMLWLLRDRSADQVERDSWMLRVLDAPAAVAARGFSAAVSANVPLVLADDTRPGNAGAWRLTAESGKGRLEHAGEEPDAVRLSARGFAALYSGVPMATLRRSGLAAGREEADPSLDAVFAAKAYMLDYF